MPPAVDGLEAAELVRALTEGRSPAEAAELLAALQAEVARRVGPPPDVDGIVITHASGGLITVTDTAGRRHALRDGGRVTLRPLPASRGGSGHTPFALLWASLVCSQAGSVHVDLSALRRNAGRWGDPSFFVRSPGKESLQLLTGISTLITLGPRQSAAVAAVGTSPRFDLAALFPALLGTPIDFDTAPESS